MTSLTSFWTNEFEFYSLQDESRCNTIKTPLLQTKGLNSDHSKLTEGKKRDGEKKNDITSQKRSTCT